MTKAEAALEGVRGVCARLPETNERLSHGRPTFFVRKKSYVMFLDNHHGDGRLALWCAAAAGMQNALVETSPNSYFVPPYVGYRGWVGVRLDRGLSRDEVAGVIEDAYTAVAPPALAEKAARERRG